MPQPDGFPGAGGGARCVVPSRGREGYYRLGRDEAGRWWLIDPEGAPFFARCVHGVQPVPPPSDAAWPRDAGTQLRAWGFNAVGIGSRAGIEDGLPFMGVVGFGGFGRILSGPGLRLPDVFDPEWPHWVELRARAVCMPTAENRALIGWVTDAESAWAQGTATGRPTLLQLCLSLEPGFATYHAAWEFVLALHGGRLDALGRAWGMALNNKEVIRELSRGESGLATRGYARDNSRWAREFARRYFSTTAAAVRAADANHLLLGCRFRGVVGAEVLAEGVYPAVDLAMPDWSELSLAVAAVGAHPVLAGEVGWADERFWGVPVGGREARLTSVERMLQRARGALERAARHPAVVGYAWGQWLDGPGEQPPFARGLLHVNGAEAREHTELLTRFNRRADILHSSPLS